MLDQAGKRPFLFVLDEFPYLVDAVPALPSIVQAQWDGPLRRTHLKVVLSGSQITTMRRFVEADQPLFGRRTGQLHLRPFTYRDVAAFVPHYSPRDRLLTYGIFGGLPGQLALLDPKRSLRANVAHHVLSSTGRLFEEGVHLLDAFLGDAAVHYSIVEAVANGEHTFSKISNRIGKRASSISRPLDWLEAMEIIGRVAPITQHGRVNPKAVRYRIRDPYLAFWHRFVVRLRATGSIDLLTPAALWDHFVAPGLDDHMGSVFEAACRDFLRVAGSASLPFQPVQVGEWWTPTSDDQVDVVAVGEGAELFVGECKWGAVVPEDLRVLQRRASRIVEAMRGVKSIHYGVFTSRKQVSGETARAMAKIDAQLYTAQDLFEPDA